MVIKSSSIFTWYVGLARAACEIRLNAATCHEYSAVRWRSIRRLITSLQRAASFTNQRPRIPLWSYIMPLKTVSERCYQNVTQGCRTDAGSVMQRCQFNKQLYRVGKNGVFIKVCNWFVTVHVVQKFSHCVYKIMVYMNASECQQHASDVARFEIQHTAWSNKWGQRTCFLYLWNPLTKPDNFCHA